MATERSQKFLCPICSIPISDSQDIIIDSYFKEILSQLPKNQSDITLFPDATWKLITGNQIETWKLSNEVEEQGHFIDLTDDDGILSSHQPAPVTHQICTFDSLSIEKLTSSGKPNDFIRNGNESGSGSGGGAGGGGGKRKSDSGQNDLEKPKKKRKTNSEKENVDSQTSSSNTARSIVISVNVGEDLQPKRIQKQTTPEVSLLSLLSFFSFSFFLLLLFSFILFSFFFFFSFFSSSHLI